MQGRSAHTSVSSINCDNHFEKERLSHRGAGGNRTLVFKSVDNGFYMLSHLIEIKVPVEEALFGTVLQLDFQFGEQLPFDELLLLFFYWNHFYSS